MSQQKNSLKDILTPDRINKAFEKTIQEVDIPKGKLVLIKEEHYPQVTKFYDEHLLQDEPICKLLGVGWNPTMAGMCMAYLNQNMSLMLVDPDNEEIMCVRVMGISTADETLTPDLYEEECMQKMTRFWKYCEEKTQFYKRYEVEEAVTFFGLGVGKRYRQQGIGTKLMEVAVNFIKNFGISPLYISASGSSSYSQKIFNKLGFELLQEFLFDDYKVDGVKVICNTGEHKSMRTYSKIFH